MQFEVIAKCHTTRARVSRMKLPREAHLGRYVHSELTEQ
jgi:hypothetical protein